MARIIRLGSLGITFVLLSVLYTYAPAQRRKDRADDFVLRLFNRSDARHRSARRNLEAILRTQPEFWREIHAVAWRLGTDPAWLLNVMACESSFDPDARNPLPGQTSSGLLQIIERTARRLGTTTEAIRRMSPMDQLRLAEKYLEPFKGRLNTLPDVYMAVFRGSIVEGGDEIVVVDHARDPRIYALNRPLDLNNDRLITKGELGLAALSVGRFLPVPTARSGAGAGNNPSGRSSFVLGREKAPQSSIEGAGSAVERAPQPRRPVTRSIYIRREQGL
jgi:Transglycosylase SLT domain